MTDYALSTPPPPRSGVRSLVVLLSVVVVLLAGAATSAIVLFVGASDEHGREVERLDQAVRSLADAENRLAETDAAHDEVVDRISGLEARNTELRRCAEPARDSIVAARDGDDAALGPAVARAADNC
ncbi:MAG: hypothetical protein HOV94_15940 [Saccharothrix sp.]|nr:hypothetical protein [Saccharothrix sp.]